MRSEEIKIELGEGVEYATDKEMELRNVNNFQGYPIAASTVVVFPDDEIKRPKIAIRRSPNKEDYAVAEKNQKKVEELEAKDSLTEEETKALEDAKAHVKAEDCIPKAIYLLGAKAGTTEGVLVYASYMSRYGKRTADAPKQEPIDGLAKYLQKFNDGKEQANALKGLTLVVADKPTKWWVPIWVNGKRTDKFEEKEFLAINVREHPECNVDQPAE
jgi:hypothetical protein